MFNELWEIAGNVLGVEFFPEKPFVGLLELRVEREFLSLNRLHSHEVERHHGISSVSCEIEDVLQVRRVFPVIVEHRLAGDGQDAVLWGGDREIVSDHLGQPGPPRLGVLDDVPVRKAGSVADGNPAIQVRRSGAELREEPSAVELSHGARIGGGRVTVKLTSYPTVTRWIVQQIGFPARPATAKMSPPHAAVICSQPEVESWQRVQVPARGPLDQFVAS